MSDAIKEFVHKGLIVKIFHDEDCESPRIWENSTTMVCFHKNYDLGDKHDYNEPTTSWEQVKNEIIKRNKGGVIILPIYLYDHSGITISTKPFQCKFDSGQIGFIFIAKKDARKIYGPLGKKQISQAYKLLEADVEIYDMYIRGEYYRFEVTDNDDNLVDSCGGYLGFENAENDAMESAELHAEIMNLQDATKIREELELQGQLTFDFQ